MGNLEIKVSKYLKSLFISAGDGVKFNLPMAAATTVLSWGLDRWKDAYIQAGQLELMYDSIKWPLDYFLKCWIENQDLYYCQVSTDIYRIIKRCKFVCLMVFSTFNNISVIS
jgi:hypothetical protein